MVYSYGKYELDGMADGDIFRYTPSDGQVECVYELGSLTEADSYSMSVNKDGIYWKYMRREAREFDGKVMMVASSFGQFLAFGEREPKTDERSMASPGWKDYFFSYRSSAPGELGEWVLEHRDDHSRRALPGGEIHTYCVLGDVLYYTTLYENIIYCYNLEDKTEETLDFSDFFAVTDAVTALGNQGVTLIAFTVTENGRYVWACGTGTLYCYDRQEDVFSYYRKPDLSGAFTALYTDGADVYALYTLEKGDIPKVVRLGTDPGQEDELTGEPVFSVEDLTE